MTLLFVFGFTVTVIALAPLAVAFFLDADSGK